MAFEETITQGMSLQDVYNTTNVNATTVYSARQVDMSTCKRAFYIIRGGLNGGGWTAQLVGSASANNMGSTNTNITGATTGSVTGSNVAATLEVRADQLTNLNSTYRYVRLVINTTGFTTLDATGWGTQAIQKPASQNNLNTTFLAAQGVCNI